MHSTKNPGRTGGSKHSLRLRERAAIEAMITQAVPLSITGEPVQEEDPLAALARRDNDRSGGAAPPPTVWRIVVFDDCGRDIIAPLMKVVDLRELGVTLYLHIDMERDAVQGAPVVYFCAPTSKNIERIAKDCGSCLYEWFYINFTSEVSRNLLEHFADLLSQTPLQSLTHIRLLDRTLNYVALSDDMFTLMLKHSFTTLNSGSDSEIEEHVAEIVRGVSHVLVSMQLLPIIVHSKTGAAEEIARRLAVRLSDAIAERQLVPAPTPVFGRPLLLLVDRSHDLSSALHHPFSYRGLLSDAAKMNLNVARVTLKGGKEEQLEIDPERDWFYRENAALEFGEIGGRLEAARKKVQEEQATLSSGAVDPSQSLNDADTMSQLVTNAPVIAERKRILDAHTKAAYGLLEMIRERKLDVFSGVERSILQHGELDRDMFQNLLRDCGTLQDRQRLYLIAYMMCKEEEDDEQFVKAQRSLLGNEPFPALEYFEHLQNWSLSTPSPTSAQSTNSNHTAEGFGWGVAQLIAQNFAATLGGTVEQEEFPLTKMVSALLQDPPQTQTGGGGGYSSPSSKSQPSGVRAQVLQTLSAYDVRSKKNVDLHQVWFSQVVVFSIGGGTVAEYDDLKRWEEQHARKSVLYGCTSLVTGDEMLDELSVLGRKVKS